MSGLLLNAAICVAIALSAFAFAWTLHKQDPKGKSAPSLKALIVFWVLVALSFLVIGARVIAAIYGNIDMDVLCYYIASVPLSFLPVPLVFFIVYVVTGDRKSSWVMALLFSVFGAVYLWFLFRSELTPPTVTYWATIITITSDIAITIYLSALFIVPTAMMIALLGLILARKIPKRDRYRIALTLVAISLVFDFILVDALAIDCVMPVVSRIFILISVVLAFLAYHPPDAVQDRLKLREIHGDAFDDSEDSNISDIADMADTEVADE